MNNSKRRVCSGEVFLCRIEEFDSGRLSELYEFRNCLLYLIQPTTYSSEVILANVVFMRNDRAVRDWRARISNLGANFIQQSKPLSVAPLDDMARGSKRFLTIPGFSDHQVSILDSRESYRELLEIAGPVITKSLLLRAHDASALHAFRPKSRLYKKITSSESLYGLIVSDSEFYTYISLKLIFEEQVHGSHHPIYELRAALSTITKGKNNSILELDFHFSHSAEPLALPINVIIGANGVGKTRALQSVARSRAGRDRNSLGFRSKQNFVPDNPIVVFSHETQRWRGYSKQRLKHISLSITGSEWKGLPAVTQEISLLRYRDFSLSTLNNILKKVIDTRNLYLKMVGVASDGYSLDLLSRETELCERIDLSAEYKYIDEFGLEHPLSSGQRAMICFCFNLVLNCKPRSLILIDEPENHLHPRFISLLIQTLHSVLLATESVAIVATHSPFVVREVDRSGVLILQANNQSVPSLFRPSMQTLGGDVSLISDFVFEDINVRKGYQESIDQALLACRDPAARKNVLDQFSALGLDAAAYVRSLE